MATILSTLYPPLIDTFMPAFPYDENVTVEFSISPYNSANMINYLHVSLVNQKTNQNAFEGSMGALTTRNIPGYLVNGIWILPFSEIDGVLHQDGDNLWHLTIPTALLKNQDNVDNKTFTIDYYYKLQLRFDAYDKNFTLIDAAYLTRNRVYFSEWSSVCLLKAIPHVDCFLKNFDSATTWSAIMDGNLSEEEISTTPQYTPGSINVTGFLTFSDGSSNSGDTTNKTTNHGEYLKSYYITVLDKDNEVLFKTEPQYTAYLTDKNDFSYILDTHESSKFPVNQTYYLQLTFNTNNNYTFSKTYSFSLIEYTTDFIPIWNFDTRTIFVHGTEEEEIITEEDGVISFTVDCGNWTPGYLYIRRESSLDNFTSSELIACKGFLSGGEVSYSIKDDTVASLVAYRYSVQYQKLNNQWTTLKYSQVVYPKFHDILIKRGDRQLAIRYNAQVSSMTPVKTRVKIDTLGGKYPKFAENANLNYKQFTISGLITAESDFNRTFLDETSSEYKQNLQRYNEYMNGKTLTRNDTVVEKSYVTQSTKHDSYPWENWWWERVFREEVIDWLNDGEPKLWRSMPEGNMIVMFDGISLTPNAQLGRRTWNISATVYEVEDGYSLSTLDSLGIYPLINDYVQNTLEGITEQIASTNYQLGQLYKIQGTTEGTSIREAVLKNIQMRYDGLNSSYRAIESSVILNSVRVQFHDNRSEGSVPHWYDLDNDAAALDSQIFISVSGGDPVTLGELLSLNNSSYSGADVLTAYLTAWETEITKGNVLVKVEFLEGKDEYGNIISGVIDKTSPNSNLTTATTVSALADNVYSLIDDIKRKAAYHYGLGYKLVANILSPYGNTDFSLKRTIFVNERGYYQFPSDIGVLDLYLYDGQIATIDYFVQWDTMYNDLKDPSGYEVGEDIVGQVSGWWHPGTNINELIYNKHYFQHITNDNATTYSGVTQELEYWRASDFDVTPYTMIGIQQVGAGLQSQKVIVGRTGTLRLGSDYPINQCIILGKRMFRVGLDRQPYLDDWEFVLDPSVYGANSGSSAEANNIYWYALLDDSSSYQTDVLVKVYYQPAPGEEDDSIYNVFDVDDFKVIYNDWYELGDSYYDLDTVKKPEYNTVYGVIDENGIFSHKLYYLDGGWYDVEFEDEEKTTILAKVPINGVINYKGNLMKKVYT